MRGRKQPSGIVEVERHVENFHHGQGFMTTNPNGSVTHFSAGNDGGYVELSTGTSSTGDLAELYFDNDYDPVAYDVFELSCEFEASTDDPSLIDARPLSAFTEDGSLDDEVRYVATDSDFITKRDDATYNDAVDDIDTTDRHTATIRWYTARGVIQLYIDGQLRHEDTTSNEHPQTTEDYTIRSLVVTEDTNADRLLRIYRYELTYYIDRLSR